MDETEGSNHRRRIWGLSCAVTLAAQGWEVTVLERQQQPGGKLQRIQAGLHLRPRPKYDYDAPCLPLAL